MKITLNVDEILAALTQVVSDKVSNVINPPDEGDCYFNITDSDGKDAELDTIEFVANIEDEK